jgi:hypothetical protein
MTVTKTFEEVKGEIQQDIDILTASFAKHQEGGFQLTEIASFTFDVGSRLVEVVEGVQGISGAQKKEVVMSAVKDIYKKVNPDIPWIPEPFETLLEDIVIDKALSAFVDFIVEKYKDKGLFN